MDWKKDFGSRLLDDGQNQFEGEKMITLAKIDDEVNFTENIRNLFYPNPNSGVVYENTLWKTMRTILV
jgi:hypothetical protein